MTHYNGPPPTIPTPAQLAADPAFTGAYLALGTQVAPAVGDYFGPAATTRSDGQLGTGALQFRPLTIPHPMSVDRIATLLVIAGGTVATMRLGIYAHDAASGRPGDLLVDAGTVNAATGESTGVKELTIALDLPAGLIWLAGVTQGADGATPSWARASSSPAHVLPGNQIPSTGLPNTYPRNGQNGALPSPALGSPGSATNGFPPIIWLRRSA